jgi:hypothetical protein
LIFRDRTVTGKVVRSCRPRPAAAAVLSLVDSLQAYIDDLPRDQQADALHQVFYGFYTRIAIIDRTTYELAAWAKDEAGTLTNVPDSLTEALRDNALFVGHELFASRVRTMRAMGYVSGRLAEMRDRPPCARGGPDAPSHRRRIRGYPHSGRISRACSCWVGSRCPYPAMHDGSAMPSCSATKPTAVAGTSVGSAKNRPSIRTVRHCTANPSRL